MSQTQNPVRFRRTPLGAAIVGSLFFATQASVVGAAGISATTANPPAQPRVQLAAACNPCAGKKKWACKAACGAKKKWACNPCAAKGCNPCAAKGCNPCAAKKWACNPCAAKKGCNPCAAKGCNPCAAKKGCNPCAARGCNPCGGAKIAASAFKRPAGVTVAAKQDPTLLAEGKALWNSKLMSSNGLACQTCHQNYGNLNKTFAKPYPHWVAMADQRAGVKEVTADEMVQFCLIVPMQNKTLAWNSRELAALSAYTVALQKGFNPCKAAGVSACNPCNPCAAKRGCNPCAAKKGCNPCAAKRGCNPCAAKRGCNPCNPCAAKKKW